MKRSKELKRRPKAGSMPKSGSSRPVAKYDIFDVLAGAGAMVFGGVSIAIDSAARRERMRCLLIVQKHRDRNPDLIDEMVREIGRDLQGQGDHDAKNDRRQ